MKNKFSPLGKGTLSFALSVLLIVSTVVVGSGSYIDRTTAVTTANTEIASTVVEAAESTANDAETEPAEPVIANDDTTIETSNDSCQVAANDHVNAFVTQTAETTTGEDVAALPLSAEASTEAAEATTAEPTAVSADGSELTEEESEAVQEILDRAQKKTPVASGAYDPSPADNYNRVYFYNNQCWKNLNVHVWNNSSGATWNNVTWPGTANASNIKESSRFEGLYYVDVPSGFDRVIWNEWHNIIACYAYYNGESDYTHKDSFTGTYTCDNKVQSALGGYPGQPMVYDNGSYTMQLPKYLYDENGAHAATAIAQCH